MASDAISVLDSYERNRPGNITRDTTDREARLISRDGYGME